MEWLANTAVAIALQTPFLIALGLHYDVLRRHNFVLGGAYALGLGALVYLVRGGWPGWAALVLAVATIAVVLFACEHLIFRPLERRGRTPDELLVASLGANLVIVQIVSVAFGDAVRFFPFDVPTSDLLIRVSSAFPTYFALAVGFGLTAVMYLFLLHTELGTRLAALGENEVLLRSLGVSRMALVTVLIVATSTVLGTSGLGAAAITGAYPSIGFNLVILGFVARLVGGPVFGPTFLAAAVGIALLDQAAGLLLPNQWRSMILFGVLLALLIGRARATAAAD